MAALFGTPVSRIGGAGGTRGWKLGIDGISGSMDAWGRDQDSARQGPFSQRPSPS